ncbi:hypothetical protein AB0F81_14035 [Actinoplanes sp. NPDC024001]|uniref:hypothetical protein n=1 Tax=Actinoplanes sp. NPDC024001 TaxID=3154598 RepID=UPI0033E06CF6
MIPQLVTVRVKRSAGRTIRLWIPVLPVALLLAPLVTLGVVVACVIYRVDAVRALATLWRVVAALPGTRFSLDEGRTAVLVIIR